MHSPCFMFRSRPGVRYLALIPTVRLFFLIAGKPMARGCGLIFNILVVNPLCYNLNVFIIEFHGGAGQEVNKEFGDNDNALHPYKGQAVKRNHLGLPASPG